MRNPIAAVLMSSLLVLGCAGPPPSVGDPPAAGDLAIEVDVCEAVIRFLMTQDDTALKDPKAIFLEVRGADPPPELLARFARERTPVGPVSAAAVDPQGGVIDRTGGPGLILRIDALRREAEGGFTVEAGYHQARRSAAGYSYTVVRRSDGWSVIGTAPLWIS